MLAADYVIAGSGLTGARLKEKLRLTDEGAVAPVVRAEPGGGRGLSLPLRDLLGEGVRAVPWG
jgi:hypothetical protein